MWIRPFGSENFLLETVKSIVHGRISLFLTALLILLRGLFEDRQHPR